MTLPFFIHSRFGHPGPHQASLPGSNGPRPFREGSTVAARKLRVKFPEG
jgi:hypothetical protein